MKQYRGYFVDNVIFNSEADIDAFLKDQAIKAYRTAVEMFMIHTDMEHSLYVDEKAKNLVDNFGFTWSDIEALEIEIYTAA